MYLVFLQSWKSKYIFKILLNDKHVECDYMYSGNTLLNTFLSKADNPRVCIYARMTLTLTSLP